MPFIFPAALKGFCNLGPIYPLNRVYAYGRVDLLASLES